MVPSLQAQKESLIICWLDPHLMRQFRTRMDSSIRILRLAAFMAVLPKPLLPMICFLAYANAYLIRPCPRHPSDPRDAGKIIESCGKSTVRRLLLLRFLRLCSFSMGGCWTKGRPKGIFHWDGRTIPARTGRTNDCCRDPCCPFITTFPGIPIETSIIAVAGTSKITVFLATAIPICVFAFASAEAGAAGRIIRACVGSGREITVKRGVCHLRRIVRVTTALSRRRRRLG